MGCSSAKVAAAVRTGTKRPASNGELHADRFGIGNPASNKEQRKQDRKLIKAFVTEFVKGRKLDVVLRSGQRRKCTVALARRLDAFSVRTGGQERQLPLEAVQAVHVGKQAGEIETPLDEFCVTLVLYSTEAITFHFDDVDGRDAFAKCLLLFKQGSQNGGGDHHGEHVLTWI